MRVAVAGVASGVAPHVVERLVSEGHQIVTVATRLHDRMSAAATETSVREQLFGCDAVVVLRDQLPRRLGSAWAEAWRLEDRARSEGVRQIVSAAREAGVRRVVQQSISCVYADQAGDWVTEESPVCITTATEPTSVGEMAVLDFADSCRTGVVLRLGQIVGDSALTRWTLRAASRRRGYGLGDPEGYAHLIHSDDVGPAIAAALQAPTGAYNVGATPSLRRDMVAAYANAVGRDSGHPLGRMARRLGASRLEPWERSLRVSSRRFSDTTGWSPRHDELDQTWFAAADAMVLS